MEVTYTLCVFVHVLLTLSLILISHLIFLISPSHRVKVGFVGDRRSGKKSLLHAFQVWFSLMIFKHTCVLFDFLFPSTHTHAHTHLTLIHIHTGHSSKQPLLSLSPVRGLSLTSLYPRTTYRS